MHVGLLTSELYRKHDIVLYVPVPSDAIKLLKYSTIWKNIMYRFKFVSKKCERIQILWRLIAGRMYHHKATEKS